MDCWEDIVYYPVPLVYLYEAAITLVTTYSRVQARELTNLAND